MTKPVCDDSLKDGVVGVVGVAHGVGASQQHLKRDVWDQSSQLLQPLPGTLRQESHGHVEGSTCTQTHTRYTLFQHSSPVSSVTPTLISI